MVCVCFKEQKLLRQKLVPGYVILLFCSDKPDHIFGKVIEVLGTAGWKSYCVLRDQWEALWRKLEKNAENSADNGLWCLRVPQRLLYFDILISNMVSGQQAEQATGSNPVTDLLPWPVVLFLSLDSCLEFLSWLPMTGVYAGRNPFFPKYFWSWCIITQQ